MENVKFYYGEFLNSPYTQKTIEFLQDNPFFISFVFFAIIGFIMTHLYFKEQNKNIRLRSKISAASFVLSLTSMMIVDLSNEKKKTNKILENTRKKRNLYKSQAAKYKRCFYAYDNAKNVFFGKSAAGKVFYNNYLKAKKLPMKNLNESFINSRKKLEIK